MKAIDGRKPLYSSEAVFTDEDGRRYSLWQWVPGVAGEFISHLRDVLARTRNRRVVLFCRVSSKDQQRNGNLDDAIKHAQRHLAKLGCIVVRTFSEVAQSSIFNFDRFEFEAAIECARRHGAILVSPSRGRFLRGRAYDRTNRSDTPTVGEFMALRRMTKGVQLATLLPPDYPEVRSHEIKRGQAAKGTRVGRPRAETRGPGALKRRMQAYSPAAKQMREGGLSFSKIAATLNAWNDGWQKVCPATVFNWIRKGTPGI